MESTRNKTTKNRHYCCICSYYGGKIVDNSTIVLHRYPADNSLRRAWLNWIKTVIPTFFCNEKNDRLCSAHFKDRMYDKTLEEHSIPTVFDLRNGTVKKFNKLKMDTSDSVNNLMSDTAFMDRNTETASIGGHNSHDHTYNMTTIANTTYKCPVCNKPFSYRHYLTQHMNSHTREKVPQCGICGKTFCTTYNLQRHIKIHYCTDHTSDTAFMDRNTETSSIGGHNSHDHTYNITTIANTTYKCSVCNKPFSCRRYLTQHMNSHTREKVHGCGICGYIFCKTYNLQRHIKIHYCTNKPFQLSTWGKSFVDESDLHGRIISNTRKKRYDYECHICGETFSLAYIFQNHLKIHHYCTVNKIKLQTNVQKSHNKEKLYQCGVCSETFSCADKVQRHSKIHYYGTDTSFQCSIWDRLCVSKNMKHRYNTRRTKETTFSCGICGKSFSSRPVLQNHVKSHYTAERYFQVWKTWKSI